MLGATFIPKAKGFDLVDGMQNSCVMLPAELLADLRQRRRCELFDDVYGDLAGEGDSFGVGAHFQILFAEAEVARTRTYRQILMTKRT
jgi:hypothetical protein